ncbi:MAG: AAA family ATPase [Candidatus Bathyarchaeota archaeon]|nr:AAA family ATPase [Candidatus Bathyarchaeota archaeon]
MLIREIILENFMSYEYARIPLRPGVNLICGPNGAGKSSILLGISVALGQSYTERSKRLSDLIRRGKDIGRVTLVLDNSSRQGRRPVRRTRKDQIYLTRVLRKDGKYWFELDNTHATRAEVLRLLSQFDVDPDNMLIIMHQDMTEQFIVLSPQEKLKLVEAAAGLEPYRRNVLEAQRKMSRILSQEESLGKMLESAEQTLNYWREQYDRYQQKKQLVLKRRFLEREIAWAEVSKREEAVSDLEKGLGSKRGDFAKIKGTINLSEAGVDKLQSEAKDAKNMWQRLLEERLALEREKAKHEFNVLNGEEILGELRSWVETGQKRMRQVLDGVILLEDRLKGSNPISFDAQISEIKTASEDLSRWPQTLESRIEKVEESAKNSSRRIADLDAQLTEIKDRTQKTNLRIDDLNDQILEKRISLAILKYQKKQLSEELDEMEKRLRALEADLAAAIKSAEEMGARIAALRSPEEVLDEIRMVDGHIAAMADVSGEIERMYESYSNLYLELKEKARVAAENREKALEEIKTRMEAWRNVIRNLLSHVSLQYQRILSEAAATGTVRLTNDHDIEATGIDILVGFKGSQPLPLNIYSQSGGERSTAVMAFLLALQQRVRSPFRAVDEYDVHMDPKNREVIASLLISAVEGGTAQYLAITPNRMLFEDKNIHIITVQNIEGTSLVREVS